MGSKSRPAPAPIQQEPVAAPYTIDANGNINVTGNITSNQLRQAQEEAKTIRTQKTESTKNKDIYGTESVADVQAREVQTLATPKKAKVRGRRSLVSDPIGGGEGRESLG